MAVQIQDQFFYFSITLDYEDNFIYCKLAKSQLGILHPMGHKEFLRLAKEQAEIGKSEGGISVGAVLTKGEEIVGRGHDRTQQLNDPIAVAELDCLRSAGRRNDYSRLTLYSTHFPTMLVAGVIIQFGIGQLIVGKQGHYSESIAKLLLSKHVPVTVLSCQ